jgi:hypothetical protein
VREKEQSASYISIIECPIKRPLKIEYHSLYSNKKEQFGDFTPAFRVILKGPDQRNQPHSGKNDKNI